jgi:SAM-dependent methyltransferase
MRDIVENRARISFGSKLRIAWRVLRDNGPSWSALFGVYYVSSAIAHKASNGMTWLRGRRGIPGLNSVALNREIWNSWDWGAAGTEWTVSESWFESCLDNVLRKWIPQGSTVLEIGPGGGRWSAALIGLADRYTGLDLSSAAVDFCRQRFRDADNAEFLVGSGTDLSGIGDETIDRIWSFDVFVHINALDVARYLDEFARALRPGGIAVIHHGTVGGRLGGWRSDLLGPTMTALLAERGFRLEASIDRWEDGGEVTPLSGYGDVVSVFSRSGGRGSVSQGPDAA